MSRRLLAVDIDNTLADYTGALRLYAGSYGSFACEDPTEYDFGNAVAWPWDDAAGFRRFHTHAVAGGLYGVEEPFPHALDALASLRSDGWRIIIATSRADDSRGETARWLKFAGVPRDGLYFGDKSALNADVYLEDNPSICEELSALGAGVLHPTHAYCLHAAGGAFHWATLPEQLKELL